MTLSARIQRAIERSRTVRPVTWLTLLGVLLLPVLVGGILVAALYDPAERLDNLSAAIVNDDDPVTIDGQTVPLGRQLTAGLVAGSDELASNLDWTISNEQDAADGLADGTYSAVVTIPQGFSAAATSTAPGSTPEQATIQVTTSPDSKIVDDAITAQITQAAASIMGRTLSETYLENVFIGFTTLGDQLGTAADGARQLASAGATAAEGATSLADGASQLSSGAAQLSTGASGLASGASTLASGASSAANGLASWAAGADSLAAGSRQISDALAGIAGQIPSDLPQVPQEVIDAARQIGENSPAIDEQLTDAVAQLTALAAQCDATATPELCAGIAQAAENAQAALQTATGIVGQAGTIADGLAGINQLPALGEGLSALAGESAQITSGIQGLAAGARQAAGGVQQLASGAAALGSGATQLASGASTLADGAASSAGGAASLAGGVGQLADGTSSLADGLRTAADSLPSYTDAEAQSLASVVADPVAATGVGTGLFGASAIPLLAMLVLWFGGLGSFVAFQAVSARALASRAPSALLALRSFAPAAVLGAVQGVLVAAVVQLAAAYDWADWSLFAALCVLAGVAFAAVNQALVAVFGGTGRWIAAIVGALAVATGIVSTVPGVLTEIAGVLPTAPAYAAMLGALTPAGGVGGGVVGMLVWSALALVATTIAVTRRRKTTARAVLATGT